MGIKYSFFIRADGLAELVGERTIIFKPKSFFKRHDEKCCISCAKSWQEIYNCLKRLGCEPIFKEKESQIPKVELHFFACYTLDQIISSYAFIQEIEDFLIAYSNWSDMKKHTLFFRFNEDWSVKLFSTSNISEILKFVEVSLPPFWSFDWDKFRITKIIMRKLHKSKTVLDLAN